MINILTTTNMNLSFCFYVLPRTFNMYIQCSVGFSNIFSTLSGWRKLVLNRENLFRCRHRCIALAKWWPMYIWRQLVCLWGPLAHSDSLRRSWLSEGHHIIANFEARSCASCTLQPSGALRVGICGMLPKGGINYHYTIQILYVTKW